MAITTIPVLDAPELSPSKKQAARWTPVLVVAALVATVGVAMPVGYNIGVLNSPDRIIKEFCNASVEAHYGTALNHDQLELLWSAIVSVFLVGGMVGSISGGWIADRLGRKSGILVDQVVNLVAAVLLFSSKYANSVEMLLVGRIIIGFSSGLATSIVPMYLTELAPLQLRGALGVCCQLGVCFGLVVSQIFGLDWMLGTECCWHVLLGLFGLLAVLSLLLMPVMPESPKYLYLVRGDEALGLRELCRIRQVPEECLAGEVRAMRLAQKAEREMGASAGAWTARRVLLAPELRLPLLLVCVFQGGQQLSGINGVFYYSNSVFIKAGLSATAAQYASLGAGIVNFGMAAVSVFLVNSCGRRPLILLSTSASCMFIAVLGASLVYIDSFSWMPFVSVASLLLFVLVFGIGMGPIPYFIGAELLDVGPRPVGMALGSLMSWGCNFLVGMTFPIIQSAIGASSFYYFAVIIGLQGLIFKLYLPETKGRDPIEVADMLKHGFKSEIATDVPPLNSTNDFIESQDHQLNSCLPQNGAV